MLVTSCVETRCTVASPRKLSRVSIAYQVIARNRWSQNKHVIAMNDCKWSCRAHIGPVTNQMPCPVSFLFLSISLFLPSHLWFSEEDDNLALPDLFTRLNSGLHE